MRAHSGVSVVVRSHYSHTRTHRAARKRAMPCGHRHRAQTRLLQPEGETGPGGAPALCAHAVPLRRVALKGFRGRGSAWSPSLSVAPASANPGRPSFPLLCAQGKHSAGRRSPEEGREAVGLQATAAGVPLSQVLAHLPEAGYAVDTAQDSRAAPSKGVTSCRAENTGVPRRGGCPERPLHSGLRNALPAYFLGSAGCAQGLDTPAPPPPRGASDLEDPTRK